jgi:hypothetical protein
MLIALVGLRTVGTSIGLALLAASAEARERWLAGKAENQPPEIPPITWRDMLLGGLGRRKGAKE